MPIRLIAIDLDGTLFNSQREISAANCEALAAAAARGATLLITTGRRFHSAQPLLKALAFPVVLVASNGALIARLDGRVIRRKFLARPIAQKALEAGGDFRRYAVAIYDRAGRGQVMMEEGASTKGPLGWYLTNCPECLEQVHDLAASLPQDRDPVQVMFGGPPAELEPLEPTLRDSAIGKQVHLTWTKYLTRNISLLDVLRQGCSKGEAVRWWAEREAIAPAEVMAIGDNFNDLEMLEFAGWPVVMGNASPGLAREGWQRTLSNDEDGVAAAIRAFVLG